MKTVPLPFGSAIFCDDIRVEVGNKQSLMGIYGGDMIFPPETSFPFVIPKLCVVFRWNEAADFTGDLKFHLLYLTGESEPFTEAAVLTVDLSLDEHLLGSTRMESDPSLPTRLLLSPVAQLAGFTVSEPGRLSARVERQGEIWRMGSLKIWVASEAHPQEGPTEKQ